MTEARLGRMDWIAHLGARFALEDGALFDFSAVGWGVV